MPFPEISGLADAIVKNKGDVLKLTCTAQGKSDMAILWKKDNVALDAGLFADEGTYTEATNLLSNVLTRTLVTADAGTRHPPYI